MRTCLVIRHLAFEDLGLLEPILKSRGFQMRVLEAGVDALGDLNPCDDDLWIVLGGPIGAYEEADYPFITDETALLRRRLAAQRPTLGVCLGAQLMALALGAKVYGNPRGKEIGWSSLTFSAEGQAHPLGLLGDAKVLHWHGDIFDLPAGAHSLASTPLTPHQAFALGRYGLGLQFHAEVEGPGLERWLIGHRAELGQAEVSIAKLRADNVRYAPVLFGPAARAVNAWLDGL